MGSAKPRLQIGTAGPQRDRGGRVVKRPLVALGRLRSGVVILPGGPQIVTVEDQGLDLASGGQTPLNTSTASLEREEERPELASTGLKELGQASDSIVSSTGLESEPASLRVGRIVELIEGILTHLPMNNIITASAVCKQWRGIILESSAIAPHIFKRPLTRLTTPAELEYTCGHRTHKYFFKTKLFQLRQWHPSLFKILEMRRHYADSSSDIYKRGERIAAYQELIDLTPGAWQDMLCCQPPLMSVEFTNRDMNGVVHIIRAAPGSYGISVRQLQRLAVRFLSHIAELERRKTDAAAAVKRAEREVGLTEPGSRERGAAWAAVASERAALRRAADQRIVLERQMRSFENGFILEGILWERRA